MREILFKAKRMDNGEWVHGYIVRHPSAVQIGESSPWYIHVPPIDPDDSGGVFNVNPETVCQYTGLTDKNGVKIFEVDILSYNGSKETVCFDTSLRIPCFTTGIGSGSSTPMHPYKLSKRHVVIGNIHDKEADHED